MVGVSQGCFFSPIFFNFQKIVSCALADYMKEISVLEADGKI